ncbi:Crp/Fnr family transcriptional regulator, partial [Thioalkalicoccus limnaeus]
TTNKILATLPSEEFGRVVPMFERASHAFGDRLQEPAEVISRVYFPNEGLLVSLRSPMGCEKGVEIAMVGSEGLIGLPVALGFGRSPVRALVQGAGSALSMESARFQGLLDACPELRREVARYTWCLIAQLTQGVACNHFLTIEGRLARWLLMATDRLYTDSLCFTQEWLASLLGVRRVGVTLAAGNLQRRGLIRYRHGHIRIQDRAGLQALVADCYRKPADDLGGFPEE